MDTNVIREAVLRRPFEPYVLRLTDGREFRVPHPEHVAVSRRVVVVVNVENDVPIYLEPALVASLHFADKTAKPPSPTDNGGGAKT